MTDDAQKAILVYELSAKTGLTADQVMLRALQFYAFAVNFALAGYEVGAGQVTHVFHGLPKPADEAEESRNMEELTNWVLGGGGNLL